MTAEVVGRYLAFLVKVGFLGAPPGKGEGEKTTTADDEVKALPDVQLGEGMGVRGRGRD